MRYVPKRCHLCEDFTNSKDKSSFTVVLALASRFTIAGLNRQLTNNMSVVLTASLLTLFIDTID